MELLESAGLFLFGVLKRAWYWAPTILLDPFDFHEKYKGYLPTWMNSIMKALSGWSLMLFIGLLLWAAIMTFHELNTQSHLTISSLNRQTETLKGRLKPKISIHYIGIPIAPSRVDPKATLKFFEGQKQHKALIPYLITIVSGGEQVKDIKVYVKKAGPFNLNILLPRYDSPPGQNQFIFDLGLKEKMELILLEQCLGSKCEFGEEGYFIGEAGKENHKQIPSPGDHPIIVEAYGSNTFPCKKEFIVRISKMRRMGAVEERRNGSGCD